MADSKQIVALNVGSQRVIMGVFTKTSKNGLKLDRYASRTLNVDPKEESLRPDIVASVVSELVSELKVKGATVNYSVAGQSVFIRFIKLPPIDNADVDQLVRFEAQQHVPFPLDEVVWDYHLLSSGGLEQEAVLVAIKTDALNTLNDSINEEGLKTGQVDCAATSLYNAFCDSYPDEGQSVVLIDIGARSTNLIYSDGGRFYTRSINIGGIFITSAIAHEFNTSFQEAEQAKLSKGAVSMTNGQTVGMDPNVAALATNIRTSMTRLASEIQRTTTLYRSQMHGNAPVKAFLCGGGASLPYTKEFLEERLGIPVSFFNPLHHIGVGSGVDVDKVASEAFLLGGIVGSALNSVGRSNIKIDLVPSSVAQSRQAQQRVPKVVTGVLLALIGAGAFAGTSIMGQKKALEVSNEVQEKADAVQALQGQIQTTVSKIKALDTQLNELKYLALQRYSYADILKEFVEKTQSVDFWIVDFDPVTNFDPENTQTISGNSVVKDSYATEKSSALANPMPKEDSSPRRGAPPRRGADSDRKPGDGLYVNAIRLKGFARVSAGGDSISQGILDKLKVNPEASLFTFEKSDGTPLETRQLLSSDLKQSTSFAKSFTILLPLKTPIPVKNGNSDSKSEQ
jgi:type IV pilus assembly protein PilM